MIDYRTGEITEPTKALVPADKSAVSVVSMLEKAKVWLATAVDVTGPEEIAAAKAQIRTAEVYAKELGLSKDIQQDAQEMVRRAEYALGKAIRKGQAEGGVATKSEMATYAGYASASQRLGQCQSFDRKPSPSSFASESELMGARGDGIYALADNVDSEEFEAALEAAKAEGNLTRANVVRKVRAAVPNKSRSVKADLLEDLAKQGFSSRQMCKALGFSRDAQVRELAREHDIEIPADKAITGTRRINSTHLVENTATALEGLVMGVELIDYASVDPAVASRWVGSLAESMRALNRFVRLTKEQTHD